MDGNPADISAATAGTQTMASNPWPRVILSQMDARPQDRALSSLEELAGGTDAEIGARGDAVAITNSRINSYICPDDTNNEIAPRGLSYRVNGGYFASSIVPGAGGTPAAAPASHFPGNYTWIVAAPPASSDSVGVQLRSGAMHNPAGNSAAQLTLDQIGNWDGTTNTLWVSENNTASDWLNSNTFGLAFGALVADDPALTMNFPDSDDPDVSFTDKGKPNLQFNDGRQRPVPTSEHSGGALVVGFCDGRATTISDAISRDVYIRLVSSGGSALSFPRTYGAARAGTPLQDPLSGSEFD